LCVCASDETHITPSVTVFTWTAAGIQRVCSLVMYGHVDGVKGPRRDGHGSRTSKNTETIVTEVYRVTKHISHCSS